MTIGERIKERRIELGYTQDELARKCGYKSRSSINKIELSRSLPLPKVTLMAKALECTESYLMGWTDSDFHFSNVSRFENVLKYSKENNIPLSDLMDGRDIQPCDYESINDPRVFEVKKRYDDRIVAEQIDNNPSEKKFLDHIGYRLHENPEYRDLVDVALAIPPCNIDKAIDALQELYYDPDAEEDIEEEEEPTTLAAHFDGLSFTPEEAEAIRNFVDKVMKSQK